MSAAVQAAMTARSGAKSWQNHSFPEEKRKEGKKKKGGKHKKKNVASASLALLQKMNEGLKSRLLMGPPGWCDHFLINLGGNTREGISISG